MTLVLAALSRLSLRTRRSTSGTRAAMACLVCDFCQTACEPTHAEKSRHGPTYRQFRTVQHMVMGHPWKEGFPMIRSCTSRSLIGHPGRPVWLPIDGRTLVSPLALISALSVANMAESQTLKPEIDWDGQYDTAIGWYPHAGFPPMCAASGQPSIAVSNGDVIHIAGNFNYGTFQRDGTNVFQEEIATFFGSGLLPSNFDIGTPELLYDDNNNRFITADGAWHVGTEQAWITVGTSAVQPPYAATTDCTYKIDANLLPGAGPTNMYPTDVRVGLNADSIQITANMHNFTDGKFQYSKLWVLPKSAVYNVPLHNCPLVSPNPSFVAWGFKMPDGTTASDVIPTKSHDASSSVNYLLSAWSGHGTELALWTLDTHQPSLSPGLTAASVRTSAYVEPPKGVPQKGTTTPISPWGSQLANAVYRPTSGLWTVHAVACQPDTNNSCFQWFELDPQHKAVVQSGVAGYSDASVYAPSVA